MDLINVDAPVPDVEVAERRQLADVLAICTDGDPCDLRAVGVVESAVPAPDLEAGCKSLNIPFPRTGQRLVEVVYVGDLGAVRRGIGAEVREVRIAAGLNPDAGVRRRCEVGSHDGRGTAIEGERRNQHPAVAQRNELGNTVVPLLLQDIDRVWPIGRRRPVSVAGARNTLARRLAGRGTLVRCRAFGLSRAFWCLGGHLAER